jgi:hypothetical protein
VRNTKHVNTLCGHCVELWRRSHTCEKRLLASSSLFVSLSLCSSVRPSAACISAAPTGRISVKIDIGDFHENLSL